MQCKDKDGSDKKSYEMHDYFQRKNYKVSVNGTESEYSVQNIVYMMATNEGGSKINIETDDVFRRLIKGINIGGHDAGSYILLLTARQLIGDIERITETAEKYYVEPMKLMVHAATLRDQGKFSQSIDAFQKANDLLAQYRTPNSHYFINVEISLSSVYYAMGEYDNALSHAEKSLALLGTKEWTGSLAPTCKEGVAYALMKINIPSQSTEAKDTYYRSMKLLHEAIALKEKNADYDQTPNYMNYENLAVAHMFTGDYASALDDIENALATHPCQKHSIFKGIALLGLGKHSLANQSFVSERENDRLLTDALIKYSNLIAAEKVDFSLQHMWEMLFGKHPWA